MAADDTVLEFMGDVMGDVLHSATASSKAAKHIVFMSVMRHVVHSYLLWNHIGTDQGCVGGYQSQPTVLLEAYRWCSVAVCCVSQGHLGLVFALALCSKVVVPCCSCYVRLINIQPDISRQKMLTT